MTSWLDDAVRRDQCVADIVANLDESTKAFVEQHEPQAACETLMEVWIATKRDFNSHTRTAFQNSVKRISEASTPEQPVKRHRHVIHDQASVWPQCPGEGPKRAKVIHDSSAAAGVPPLPVLSHTGPSIAASSSSILPLTAHPVSPTPPLQRLEPSSDEVRISYYRSFVQEMESRQLKTITAVDMSKKPPEPPSEDLARMVRSCYRHQEGQT